MMSIIVCGADLRGPGGRYEGQVARPAQRLRLPLSVNGARVQLCQEPSRGLTKGLCGTGINAFLRHGFNHAEGSLPCPTRELSNSTQDVLEATCAP